MPIFGKKEEKPAQPSSPVANIPVEQVVNLRGQGISNNQIVEMLQRDGYKTHQIFDAMNQADLRGPSPQAGAGADMRVQQVPEFGNSQNQNPMMGQFPQSTPQMSSQMQMPPQPPVSPVPDFTPEELEHQALREEPKNYSQNYAADNSDKQQISASGLSDQEIEKIEEIAEAIIDEKWNEFIVNVNKIVAWKERTEARMSALEKRFEDVKGSVDELQKTMLGRIGDYDRHVTDVGTEIKAMEKVFQKVLPSFTSNVNELSRITSDLKEKRRGD